MAKQPDDQESSTTCEAISTTDIASSESKSEDSDSQNKSGRSLSTATLNTLKDVRDDLGELIDTDLKRAQKALVERCHNKLGQIIEKAEPPEDDEKRVIVELVPQPRELTTQELQCRALTLDTEELTALKANIDAVLSAEQNDMVARQFRDLIGV
jgi:DNA-binding MarR family transcriptional regulator